MSYKTGTKIRREAKLLNDLAYKTFEKLSGNDRKLFLEIVKRLEELANEVENEDFNENL